MIEWKSEYEAEHEKRLVDKARIAALEAALRDHDGWLARTGHDDDHPWRLSIARALGGQSETEGKSCSDARPQGQEDPEPPPARGDDQ